MIAQFVRREVIAKFPEYHYIAVGGLIFLRFLCPAISSPEASHLIPGPPPEEYVYYFLFSRLVRVRRPLVLVSKTLQTLANGIAFRGKEEYMLEMNLFLDANRERVCRFLDAFAVSLIFWRLIS